MKKSTVYWLNLCILCVSLQTQATQPQKITTCTPCHGVQGISPNPSWPNLAHQHRDYLLKQLHDFKTGTTRNAGMMQQILQSLSEQDLQALADYFSKQPPVSVQPSTPSINARGQTLYQQGDKEKHITACSACHGPDGLGNRWAGFPALAHQQADYIVLQLQAFKTHERKNDAYETMRRVASRMSRKDMRAVANYIHMTLRDDTFSTSSNLISK